MLLKNHITIVIGTSPHRFGESDCMIKLNYEIFKASQLNNCRIIVCADGLNEHSRFYNKQDIENYDKYLSKIKKTLPKAEVICAKEHIGLTKNYSQAWDIAKINTPYTLLMNHDAVLCDNILDINFQELIENWPEAINLLIFPREISNERAGAWWRQQDLLKFKKIKKIPKGWEKCKLAFGNQDHSALIKTEKWNQMVKNFYKPEETHFLEDSIQEYLQDLEVTDISRWEKFGGVMYEESTTLHVDGQSKAGESFSQEEGRGGEKVWSNGQYFWFDFLRFSRFIKINPKITESIQEIFNENIKFHKQICLNKFTNLFESANYLVTLKKSKEAFFSEQDPKTDIYCPQNAPFPSKQNDINLHFCFSQTDLKIEWSTPTKKKLLLKLTNESDNQQILWGGHPFGYAEIDLQKNQIPSTALLKIELFDYTENKPPYEKKLQCKLPLSFCNFKKDKLILASPIKKDQFISLHATRDDGSLLRSKKLKNGVFEIDYKDMQDSRTVLGFFKYKNKEEITTSMTFECKPEVSLLFANPSEILRKSFIDFLFSLLNEKNNHIVSGQKTYWNMEVEKISKQIINEKIKKIVE